MPSCLGSLKMGLFTVAAASGAGLLNDARFNSVCIPNYFFHFMTENFRYLEQSPALGTSFAKSFVNSHCFSSPLTPLENMINFVVVGVALYTFAHLLCTRQRRNPNYLSPEMLLAAMANAQPVATTDDFIPFSPKGREESQAVNTLALTKPATSGFQSLALRSDTNSAANAARKSAIASFTEDFFQEHQLSMLTQISKGDDLTIREMESTTTRGGITSHARQRVTESTEGAVFETLSTEEGPDFSRVMQGRIITKRKNREGMFGNLFGESSPAQNTRITDSNRASVLDAIEGATANVD